MRPLVCPELGSSGSGSIMRNVTLYSEGKIPVCWRPLPQQPAEAMNYSFFNVNLPVARVTVEWLLIIIVIQVAFKYLYVG